jgi:hypothetical protein
MYLQKKEKKLRKKLIFVDMIKATDQKQDSDPDLKLDQ